jgi:FtsP/CotA-like multicopper oxidase with cupredoxin domain
MHGLPIAPKSLVSNQPHSGRRRFLAQVGWGIGLLAGGQTILGRETEAGAGDRSAVPVFEPDVEIALRATSAQAQILPGAATDVWSLQGKLLRGESRCLEPSMTPALGPTIRVRAGQRLRIQFENDIPQDTIIHWHGLRVPASADGHPRFAIPQGQHFVYEFVVEGPAGTYFYHAHPHRLTGEQVYRGLAGVFIVEDEHEASLGMPLGAFDVALVIQDRAFDSHNQLVYLASPMQRMRGFLGDRVLVNGKPNASLPVAARPYRLRLVNASNSRIYRLAWADGSLLTVVGTDGGLLEAAVSKPYVMLAPGERIDVWADFSARPVGSDCTLVSLAFDGMTAMGPMGSRGLPQGSPLTILKFRVDRPSSDRPRLADWLATIERFRLADAVNASAPRTVRATMQHMSFGINGRSFEMDAVAKDEHVKLGTLEAWEFDNTSAGGMGMMGMMMGMERLPHPFHVHGGQFQVVWREGVTHAGYVDSGWKDTVLVMPGEKATVLVRFLRYPGLYMVHCHNLEHEDAGMMRNFYIDS